LGLLGGCVLGEISFVINYMVCHRFLPFVPSPPGRGRGDRVRGNKKKFFHARGAVGPLCLKKSREFLMKHYPELPDTVGQETCFSPYKRKTPLRPIRQRCDDIYLLQKIKKGGPMGALLHI